MSVVPFGIFRCWFGFEASLCFLPLVDFGSILLSSFVAFVERAKRCEHCPRLWMDDCEAVSHWSQGVLREDTYTAVEYGLFLCVFPAMLVLLLPVLRVMIFFVSIEHCCISRYFHLMFVGRLAFTGCVQLEYPTQCWVVCGRET